MKVDSVLVAGGAGFIGRHLVAALAARGVRVTVPSRRRERAKHLILLPTVDVVEADVMADGVLERLAAGKQAVINLIGILHGRRGRPDERGPNDYGPAFARAHVEFPQAVVAACRKAGVRRLLHMSALGASRTGSSEYQRSKGVGEEAVLAANDLDVTVFRPSVVFGPEDRFLNQFAFFARYFWVLTLPCPDARFQPVYVGDVVRSMVASIVEAEAYGKRYDLCGPDVYTMRELVEFVCSVVRRRPLIVGLSDRLSRLQAAMLEFSPGPLMSRDNVRSMQVPNVCPAGCTLPFGLVPHSLEAIAPAYLAQGDPRERYPELRWRARR